MPCWLGACLMRKWMIPTSGRNYPISDHLGRLPWPCVSDGLLPLWSLALSGLRALARSRAVCTALSRLRALAVRAITSPVRPERPVIGDKTVRQGQAVKAIRTISQGNQDNQTRQSGKTVRQDKQTRQADKTVRQDKQTRQAVKTRQSRQGRQTRQARQSWWSVLLFCWCVGR